MTEAFHRIKIGMTVYHRSVYAHKEPLKVVGILENALLLEGDYSGGTNNVVQQQWLPLKGTSFVYDHAYKQECRYQAVCFEELTKPIDNWSEQDNMAKAAHDFYHRIMVLTTDITLNPEF